MKLLETLLHELSMKLVINENDIRREIGSVFRHELGSGSSRAVFDLKNGYVAKVPHVASYREKFSVSTFKTNARCNFCEYLLFKASKDLPLLPCELYFYNYIPIIVMPKVDSSWARCKDLERPERCGAFADGFQAGRTSDGLYLAYDYGYEERLLEKEFPGFDITKEEYEKFISGEPEFLKTFSHIQTELVFTP